MTTGDKAKRTTVAIGSLPIDGFQMPDGSYRMSQAGAAKAINESPVYALRCLASRDSKALLGEAFADYTQSKEPDALREQVARLDQQLHDAGLEPWHLPPSER